MIIILTTDSEITVVGLGYVGLPLAVAFAKKRITIGFDLNPERISQLQSGIDLNLEVSSADLLSAKNLKVTNKISDIEHSNVYVITVPTPIDDQNIPNFDYLVSASEIVGSVLKENDIVIYESTVYPGATEEICVPVLEKISRLKFNYNFLFDTSYSDGQYRKTADNSKLLLNFGNFGNFEFTDLKIGIYKTIDWFIDNYENLRK